MNCPHCNSTARKEPVQVVFCPIVDRTGQMWKCKKCGEYFHQGKKIDTSGAFLDYRHTVYPERKNNEWHRNL